MPSNAKPSRNIPTFAPQRFDCSTFVLGPQRLCACPVCPELLGDLVGVIIRT
jgi:hypothetical protein